MEGGEEERHRLPTSLSCTSGASYRLVCGAEHTKATFGCSPLDILVRGTEFCNEEGATRSVGAPTTLVVLAVDNVAHVYDGGATLQKPLNSANFGALIKCLAISPRLSAAANLVCAACFAVGGMVVTLRCDGASDADGKGSRCLVAFNAEGALCESGATAVAWLPASASASPNMFAVAHSNGQVLFFDISLKQEASLASDMDAAAAQAKAAPTGAGHIVSARNKPGHNPVEQWSVSDKSVRDIGFSPNGQYFACACADGFCRLYHWEDRQLLVGFRSWFGGFLCLGWSHDSGYLATGGEDDVVSVWDVEQRAIVARGEVHDNWISKVAFDGWLAPSEPPGQAGVQEGGGDARPYRLVSVGQDAKLHLWDFVPVEIKGTKKGADSNAATANLLQESVPQSERGVAFQPLCCVAGEQLHLEPLGGLAILRQCLLTVCYAGVIKLWERPEGHEKRKVEVARSKEGKEVHFGDQTQIGKLPD